MTINGTTLDTGVLLSGDHCWLCLGEEELALTARVSTFIPTLSTCCDILWATEDWRCFVCALASAVVTAEISSSVNPLEPLDWSAATVDCSTVSISLLTSLFDASLSSCMAFSLSECCSCKFLTLCRFSHSLHSIPHVNGGRFSSGQWINFSRQVKDSCCSWFRRKW